jgi:hypothetical protein
MVPTIVAVVTCAPAANGMASSSARTANWSFRKPKFLMLITSMTSDENLDLRMDQSQQQQ